MSEQDERSAGHGRPSRLGLLDDYLSGTLAGDEAARFEEELFEAAAEGQAAEAVFVEKLQRTAEWLAAQHQFGEAPTRARIEELLASGRPVHMVDLCKGGEIPMTPWPDETEVVLFELHVDMRGYEQIELASFGPDGSHVITFRDVTCDPETGHILGCCLASVAALAYAALPVTMHLTGALDGKRHEVATVKTLAPQT